MNNKENDISNLNFTKFDSLFYRLTVVESASNQLQKQLGLVALVLPLLVFIIGASSPSKPRILNVEKLKIVQKGKKHKGALPLMKANQQSKLATTKVSTKLYLQVNGAYFG